MRLIDADALIDKYQSEFSIDVFRYEILEDLNEAPTVEAVPVVHGHWINCMNYPLRCSNCGIIVDSVNGIPWANKSFKYCPHCGAKMDGKQNG